jgi:hypothetical protein
MGLVGHRCGKAATGSRGAGAPVSAGRTRMRLPAPVDQSIGEVAQRPDHSQVLPGRERVGPLVSQPADAGDRVIVVAQDHPGPYPRQLVIKLYRHMQFLSVHHAPPSGGDCPETPSLTQAAPRTAAGAPHKLGQHRHQLGVA